MLGLALLAIFAFSVVATATASAELFLLAEWLYNGAIIPSELLVESSGELLLEDNKVPILGKAMVLCSGILDGFVGPGSADLITELLNLGKEPISKVGLSGLALEGCTNQENCPEPLVWAVNLPWETELELHEDPGPEEDYVVLILGKPGWEIECMGIGQSDECVAETEGGFLLDNTTPTPAALFSEEITELMGLKLAKCLLGGNESGIVGEEGLIEHPEGGTISASSGA